MFNKKRKTVPAFLIAAAITLTGGAAAASASEIAQPVNSMAGGYGENQDGWHLTIKNGMPGTATYNEDGNGWSSRINYAVHTNVPSIVSGQTVEKTRGQEWAGEPRDMSLSYAIDGAPDRKLRFVEISSSGSNFRTVVTCGVFNPGTSWSVKIKKDKELRGCKVSNRIDDKKVPLENDYSSGTVDGSQDIVVEFTE